MMTLPTKSPALPRLTSLVTVGVCSTVLLTVMAMLLLVDHFAVDYAAREAAQRLQQLSWQMRDSLNRAVQKAGGDVLLLSELPQVRDANSPAEIRQLLENLQKTFPDYAWIGLAYPDGSIYAGTQGLLEGVDVSARPWFKGGQQQLYAGDYHPATLLGKQLPPSADPWRFVDVAAPVHRSNGSYRGVLCVHMSWGWARRLAKTMLAPATQQYAAEFIVVRGDGTVMLGPPGMEEQQIALARRPQLPDRLFADRQQRRPGLAEMVHPGAPAGGGGNGRRARAGTPDPAAGRRPRPGAGAGRGAAGAPPGAAAERAQPRHRAALDAADRHGRAAYPDGRQLPRGAGAVARAGRPDRPRGAPRAGAAGAQRTTRNDGGQAHPRNRPQGAAAGTGAGAGTEHPATAAGTRRRTARHPRQRPRRLHRARSGRRGAGLEPPGRAAAGLAPPRSDRPAAGGDDTAAAAAPRL